MTSKRWMVAIAWISALVLLMAAPAAFAHHTDGHEQGGGNDGGSTVTEDNDSDGVPNEPDPEGDDDNMHPSGRDKHAEGGGSGNQGKTASNPDNDGHGPERNSCDGSGEGECVDQPHAVGAAANLDGGDDTLDQDGNNGCGNDDDFEDDNEGWCGKPTPANVIDEEEEEEEKDVVEEEDEQVLEDEVLGDVQTRSPSGDVVLGASQTSPGVGAAEAAGALPFTGGALIPFAALGLGLIGGGTALVRTRRR